MSITQILKHTALTSTLLSLLLRGRGTASRWKEFVVEGVSTMLGIYSLSRYAPAPPRRSLPKEFLIL
jgi:hypothetical protein